jgi:hypothetical protein
MEIIRQIVDRPVPEVSCIEKWITDIKVPV